jgi:hypothetical protein
LEYIRYQVNQKRDELVLLEKDLQQQKRVLKEVDTESISKL